MNALRYRKVLPSKGEDYPTVRMDPVHAPVDTWRFWLWAPVSTAAVNVAVEIALLVPAFTSSEYRP